jgi:cytoskeletal protein CcmA (bactofilin family)
MFGSKKTEPVQNKANGGPTPSGGLALNSLVKGTFVEGTVSSESDIRIDGSIKGTLTCKAKVILGPTGVIEGEIKCVNAVIEGKFQGILYVEELLQIRETAEVTGDVYTNKLNVQPGANFNGAVKMASEAPKNKPQPQTPPTNQKA